MTSPLIHVYDKIRDLHPEQRPHKADSVANEDGTFSGLVRHGGASSTTLPGTYDSAVHAKEHAQIFVDALNSSDKHLDRRAIKAAKVAADPKSTN